MPDHDYSEFAAETTPRALLYTALTAVILELFSDDFADTYTLAEFVEEASKIVPEVFSALLAEDHAAEMERGPALAAGILAKRGGGK